MLKRYLLFFLCIVLIISALLLTYSVAYHNQKSARNNIKQGEAQALSHYNIKTPETMAADHLKFYFLTYNVNGRDPQTLRLLFNFDQHDEIDVYAISFQELPYALLYPDYWKKQCEKILSQKGYVLLKEQTMTVTSLLVFVKKMSITDFYKVEKTYSNVDLFHRKGGVAIRFFWNSLSFCIVGSHLAPHDYNYEKRNDNYHYILNHATFDKGQTILNHDFAFWMGDLNYRLNTINFTEISNYIRNAESESRGDRFQNLLNYDQLSDAKRNRLAFSEFNEELISFSPTYKFHVGTQSYNEQRKPAFTDRILYRSAIISNSRAFVTVFNYSSLPKLLLSDHKPVRMIAQITDVQKALKAKIAEIDRSRSRELSRSQGRSRKTRSVFKSATTADQYKDVYSTGVNSDTDGQQMSLAKSVPKRNLQAVEDDTLKSDSLPLPSSSSSASLSESFHSGSDEDDEEGETSGNLLEVDEGTKISRKLDIQFEPVQEWRENEPKTIRFRIINRDFNQSVQPYPELFKKVLSEWDYIGLLKEDWLEKDEYISFVYPDFDYIEEAHEADVGNEDQDAAAAVASDFVAEGHDFDVLLSPRAQEERAEALLLRASSSGGDGERREEYSYTARFGNESTLVTPPGRYQLLYYRSNGDVLGMSDPFEIRRGELPDFPEQ